jgi:hypothetical protein
MPVLKRDPLSGRRRTTTAAAAAAACCFLATSVISATCAVPASHGTRGYLLTVFRWRRWRQRRRQRVEVHCCQREWRLQINAEKVAPAQRTNLRVAAPSVLERARRATVRAAGRAGGPCARALQRAARRGVNRGVALLPTRRSGLAQRIITGRPIGPFVIPCGKRFLLVLAKGSTPG